MIETGAWRALQNLKKAKISWVNSILWANGTASCSKACFQVKNEIGSLSFTGKPMTAVWL
jgi:hypothetical protein